MAADIFTCAIPDGRRVRDDRLVAQVPANICGEFGRRGITSRPVFLQSLERDGIGIAAQLPGKRWRIRAAILRRNGGLVTQRAQLCARTAAHPARGADAALHHRQASGNPAAERRYQQFIEHDTERVDVGACVDVFARRVSLLGTHVAQRVPMIVPTRVYMVPAVSFCESCLGNTEVDNSRHGLAVDLGDEDVRRLEVAMDDGFLVRVLYAFADVDEELHAAGAR